MNRRRPPLTRGLICLLILPFYGCKTSSAASSEQSLNLPSISVGKIEWMRACEAELKKPGEGEANRRDLIELVGSDDCGAAYSLVKSLLADKTHTPTL